MSVRSSQSVTVGFTTQDSTGAAKDADSLPSGTLVVNGTDNGASVTVTKNATGDYKAAVTLPTLTLGDQVHIRIAATVDTVAGKGIIWRDTKDFFAGSIPDVAAGANGGLLIAGNNAATAFAGLTTGAFACTTFTASDAVAFQSTFVVTGGTTFTGAVTATHASNAIYGCKLSSIGLDALPTTPPAGVAGTYREMGVQTWARFFEPAELIDGITLLTKSHNGLTTRTTQAVSDDGEGNEVQGAAT